jgi:biotin synthesis protein BioG
MKAERIVHEGSPDLLLLFNGWGMDRRVADWLLSASPEWSESGSDIVVLYDYRELTFPSWLVEAIAVARSVDLLAWSLGVWAASNAGLMRVSRAVAINGTLWPVDACRGIPPDIFTGTLENWSDENRKRFERRMFAAIPPDTADSVRSVREVSGQREELRSIGEAISRLPAEPPSAWSFSKALIGGRDQIFSPDNQRLAWLEAGVPVTGIAGMPHFPFTHITGWQELFS